jgi:hypothetical protein
MKILSKLHNLFKLIRVFISFKGFTFKGQLTSQETIDYLIEKKVSFIRWGDGETAIFLGDNAKFQDYKKELKDSLSTILNNYNILSNKVLLGVPNFFLNIAPSKLFLNNKLKLWYKTIYLFKYKFLKASQYYKVGDAFVFRPLSPIDNTYISKLWQNKKVIIITSDKDLIFDFQKRYSNVIGYIIIPERNVFDYDREIQGKLKSLLKSNDKRDLVILISAGPYAKYLAMQLVEQSILVYDVGNYFSWKFKGISNSKGI